MKRHDHIVCLEISSFIGIGIGASHYYGDLVGYNDGDYTKITLKRKLTQRSATKLSKQHGREYKYRPGTEVHNFDSRDDIIKLAIATYKQYFPQAKVLMVGSYADGDPQQVLDGPADFVETVNKWWKRAEKIGYYDHKKNEKEMDRIANEYWKYLKEYQVYENE